MSFRFKALRLKWKVFLFLLSFCALLLLILWLFQTVFIEEFYKSIKVSEIKSNAKTLALNIDATDLQSLVSGISQDSNICIEVVADDIILYSSDVQKDCYIHKMQIKEKLALIDGAGNMNGEFYEYIKASPPRPFDKYNGFERKAPPASIQPPESLIYVRLVNNSEGKMHAILMNSVITPLNATVTTLRYQLYIITAILILLATILAFVIAKLVSRPIEKLSRSAKDLARGNYNTNFNGKGFLEIVELSDTLNTTAKELNKVETLRRELMANISHDLRTPLSLIYGYAEVMHDFPQEITQEQTQVIMEEVQRLTSLVNDVLDISKFEAGVQKLRPSCFSITRSIKSTSGRMSELLKKDGYKVTFFYDSEVMVIADEVYIMQALYNLLVNAINYTGDDKTISIRQIVSGDTVRIEVEDSGKGIEPENLPYIWDRYYKVDKKHRRAVTGTGLGLSIVKKVIELHGGDYGVESPQSRKGSIFWFSLKSSSFCTQSGPL